MLIALQHLHRGLELLVEHSNCIAIFMCRLRPSGIYHSLHCLCFRMLPGCCHTYRHTAAPHCQHNVVEACHGWVCVCKSEM